MKYNPLPWKLNKMQLGWLSSYPEKKKRVTMQRKVCPTVFDQ